MDLHHLHLVLNHFPVIGTIIAIVLLTGAFIRTSSDLRWITLCIVLGLALVTIPVYLTGEPAEEAVEGTQGVSEAIIERHEEAALPALVLMEVSGGFSLIVMLLLWRRSRFTRLGFGALLVMSIVTAASMGWTANIGGQIRHKEIRAGQAGGDTGGPESEHNEENEH